MATTEAFPGTFANVSYASGDITWNTSSYPVANLGADDGSDARTEYMADQHSYVAKCTNFDFSSISDSDTIDGIEVIIEGGGEQADRIYDSDGSDGSGDDFPHLYKAGSLAGTGKLNATLWPIDPTIRTYPATGGSTDLWGTTWTVAEIKNSGFGVGLRFLRSGSSKRMLVDYVKIRIHHSASGADYTLTAASGSLSLTGQTSSLLASRLLEAAQGSITLAGQASSVLAGRLLSAAQGTVSLTGQDVSLLTSRLLSAEQGTISLSGQNTLLLVARLLDAAQGTISLSGQDVTLTYSGAAPADYTLTADSGVISLSGQTVGLLSSRVITAEQGVISLTGMDADILFGRLLTAESGSITITGQDADALVSRLLTASQGTINLSGQAITLVYSGASEPVTPDGRIYAVSDENRIYAISSEGRIYVISI